MMKLEMKHYNMILTERKKKISPLSSGKINKYECLTSEEILPSDKSRMIEQAKFTYAPLGKAFKKKQKQLKI